MIIVNHKLRIRIVLDEQQVFPEDPGQGTPDLVEKLDATGRVIHTATFNCATSEGELDCGEYHLTDPEWDWLNAQADAVDKWWESRPAHLKSV